MAANGGGHTAAPQDLKTMLFSGWRPARWLASGEGGQLVAVVTVASATAVLWHQDGVIALDSGVMIVVAAWGGLAGALYRAITGMWRTLPSLPTRRFRALAPEAERLLAEFAECGHVADPARYGRAMSGLAALSGDLASLGVWVETHFDDDLGETCRENAHELWNLVHIIHVGDLAEAREVTGLARDDARRIEEAEEVWEAQTRGSCPTIPAARGQGPPRGEIPRRGPAQGG